MNNPLENLNTNDFWIANPVSQHDVLEKGGTLQRVLFWDGANSPKIPETVYQGDLIAEHCNYELLILYIGRGESRLKLRLDIRHLSPRTRSRITLKALLFDQSTLDFIGNIYVPGKAAKTDTFMRCETLLMSKSAKAKTIPALEIIANDVKAGHAASIGKMDGELLFYLKTRGFSSEQAQKVLIDAFLHGSLNGFSDLKADRQQLLEKKLMQITENIVL